MSLQFIYGRAGSGKTAYCLHALKQQYEKGEGPLVLLVPEQATHQTERELADMLGRGGVLGPEVLSFRRLAYRILNETGGITYPHIHPSGNGLRSAVVPKRLRPASPNDDPSHGS